MASIRLFQRHLASIVSENRRHLANNRVLFAKGFQSLQGKTEVDHEVQDSKSAIDDSHTTTEVSQIASSSLKEESNVKYTAISSLKASTRHDLAMVFTCNVCETRSVKTTCRESYEKGVVVVKCGGCNNLHLIADHLGWFGEPGNIEQLLLSRGEQVKKGSVDSLNLTLEDLTGAKSF